jgi:hypothetical protein
MTVTERASDAGDATGDTGGEFGVAGGEPVTPSPASVQPPLNCGRGTDRPVGRFWVLESSDDEQDDEDAMVDTSSPQEAGSWKYLCRTPEVIFDRELFESTQDLARRASKRLHRRQAQRKAAMDFMAMEGTSFPPLSTPLTRSVPKSLNLPVLEPSVFHDDGQEGWTVVHRRRWSPETDKIRPDPVIAPVNAGRSKIHGLGSLRLRPSSVFPDQRGPGRILQRRVFPGKTDGSVETHRPIQVKVGEAVAGHAFRRLLGFTWRKLEKGKHVVQQPHSSVPMSGDGGNGGFNPGRGAFNHGRGGFQARGGFAAGRGGNARGRMGHGGGRGGQGFNGGRGYQGNGHAGFGRNFVQGESSGTGSGGNFSNARGDNWGGQRNYNNNFGVTIEVQRLKNFGSYVCPKKDTVLFFDFWSSVEEPLYRLPEVWVRVDGIPSDMRADYLSLWGIGSLFGKTLDVDMPFTRKNKLLRIKIGCLDRNLIPQDSDVFIRRGFYKLRFEVEEGDGVQEVNMTEANYDNNGGGDPNNGLGQGDGHNDMEMDARGMEDEANANNNGNVGNGTKNGEEGMQEKCGQVDEIYIGTLKLPVSPLGNASSGNFLTQKNIAFTPILHAKNLSLNKGQCADSYADSTPARFASGIADVYCAGVVCWHKPPEPRN